ncbi:hypothetical protein [Pseudonocardia alni]|uniref:TetR family transcriptional regulator n=1 Tax=Pseudonocardia alni TaxID=33907 RepID=A0A852W8V4_PSEA5|nr:hypothetical protein [Pseudonocardia antarctica]NYG05000.1 hypothetical protein [Pseudonocardia antarctica]
MPRPRQFDEDELLQAVGDQFWDAGYAATSLQDLMRVSGLGKGASTPRSATSTSSSSKHCAGTRHRTPSEYGS